MLFDKEGNFNIVQLFSYPDNDYNKLKNEALKCSRCLLRKKCNGVVMGEGSLTGKIMLIGEGPGANEDRLGRPFVGRAGKLMNEILEAVNLKREDIYITNIVKCRPPGNRVPTKEEFESCVSILMAEINLIEPKVIVPLGSTALKFLIDPDASITKLRGKWIQRGEYFILPTFHPAYLLRNKKMKKYSWHDFKIIKKSADRIKELKSSGSL
ncbi:MULTISPECIES: uracil-DNA glycosylase [unclassified Halanaerobium]|uniref:uracil-DNA glycosylase n=1 Tax=unclassified Halanaerobium TaxID=2641197 RepID=UPI000DF3BDB6|nr:MULTISPECIES: uracil-DNA glycosylase [unclassified Halanaerobium]RCW51488.1 DNA polymerase [Halanaerobium sp. MA284_MarDTE_T2]RCW89276.1 DNA polymerase [Halanaerobium sp. DL-01]